MGKSNAAVKNWISVKERFADFYNGTVFDGRQVVRAEELQEISGESDLILRDKDGKAEELHRYRDVIMRWKGKMDLVILACENQEKVHYAMPVRNMIYDGLAYIQQMKEIWEEHGEDRKPTEDEFLSRFLKDDKVKPVVTLVFYYGEKEWDGSRSLYEMMDFGGEEEEQKNLKAFIPNYPINLVDVGRLGRLDGFQTDLQVVFGMIKYKGSRYKKEIQSYVNEHREYFGCLSWDDFLAIREMMNLNKKMEKILEKENKEVVDMCGSLDALCEDYREEGEKIGRSEGFQLAVKICKELVQCVNITDEELAKKYHCTKEEVTNARTMFAE